MDANRPGVADIFRCAGPAFRRLREGSLDAVSSRIMAAIERCRTPALGGQLYRCGECGHHHVAFHSCRNRHCPTCQGDAARRWMEAQAASVLPVPYFHIVCTLPPPIAQIAFQNRRVLFPILFRTSAETLATIAADSRRFGVRIGGTAVLHTWNQRLEFHPHLHCVLPNAGFDVSTGQWRVGSSTFFAPVKVLARYFRRRFLEETEKAVRAGTITCHGSIASLQRPGALQHRLDEARQTEWIVYAKKPFAGPEALIRYLSRYTHRVSIGDRRILAFDGQSVDFRYRKPASKPGQKPRYGSMRLPATEFIRRFLLHALPPGMHRIRHFGILANGCRKRTLEAARNALGCDSPEIPEADRDILTPCPHCGGSLRLLLNLGNKPLTGVVLQWIDSLEQARAPPQSGTPRHERDTRQIDLHACSRQRNPTPAAAEQIRPRHTRQA